MAFEPNFERVAYSYRVKLGTTQAVIECKLPANDNSEINKILCANAKAYIANSEIGEGEVNFNGFVNFLVIYESADGVTQSLDYSAEFKDKFKNEKINIGDVANVTAAVVDVNTTTVVGSSDVKVVAVVEINIDLITTNNVEVLTGATGEQVFTQNEMVNLNSLASVITERFELLQDVEIRDAVSQVLSVCNSAFIDSVTPNNGYVTVRGGVNINVCYLTNAEMPEIRSYQTNFDFSQEIASNSVLTSSHVQSELNLLYSDIKVTTNLNADSSVINLVLPLLYTGYVFNSVEVDAVTDIFSTEHQLTVATESLINILPLNSTSYTEKISGNVVTDESTPFIDEVLGNCCNHVVLATSYFTDNTLVVEGIAYTTVLYLNKETNTNNSIEVEIPFSLNLIANNLPQNAVPIVNISLGDVLTRSKRVREIEVNANLFVFANFYSDVTEAVIISVAVGEEKPESDCVLSVYIAKPGDTLWDIAKELNTSPDMILEQNPLLELPITGGERIVIYRQREVLF